MRARARVCVFEVCVWGGNINDSKFLLLLLLLSWTRARAYAGIIVPSLVFAGFIRAVVQPHMGSPVSSKIVISGHCLRNPAPNEPLK